MLPISVIFAGILTSCSQKEEDTSATTQTDPQTETVEFAYSCDDEVDWCFETSTTVSLGSVDFESYLNEEEQLTEESCLQICVDQEVPSSYNICGCSYDGVNDSGGYDITCVAFECAVEGRVHGMIQKAARTSGPTVMARWFARAFHAEASSVGAFTLLASELGQHNAPRSLVKRCMNAAKEEVMHARMMSRYCAEEGGKASPLDFGSQVQRSLFELALDNAVEGCIFETYAALRAHYQSLNAEDKRIRKIMKVIAQDETKHAQLAWDIHSWLMPQLTDEQKIRISEAQREAQMQLKKSVEGESQNEMAKELGLPSKELASELCLRLAA